MGYRADRHRTRAPINTWFAWLSVELLGHLPGGLVRPLPVDIGRFRYRSGFAARHSADGLSPFRAPKQAVRDTALSLNRRSCNLRPARNPPVYASFSYIAGPAGRTPANSLNPMTIWRCWKRLATRLSSSRNRLNSSISPSLTPIDTHCLYNLATSCCAGVVI